jgi:hypothetical protein
MIFAIHSNSKNMELITRRIEIFIDLLKLKHIHF